MILFSDNASEYQLLDFSPTHNVLLIRSMRNKARSFNIDIFFKPTSQILLPTFLKGIEISIEVADGDVSQLIKNYNFSLSNSYRIFSIKNAIGQKYYVNAMAMGIYHNELDILITSIGRYDWEDHGEKRLWYAE